MYLTYHILQEQLLVSGLHLCKVALDAVELRAVGYVEDLRDVQLLEEQLRAPGLVHGKVVEEEGEVAPAELASELANECDEVYVLMAKGWMAKSMRPPSSYMAATIAKV